MASPFRLPPPIHVNATDGVVGTVTVTWDAMPGAISYTVYRGTRPLTTTTDLIYVDTTMVAGVTYTYGVTANSVNGCISDPGTDTGYGGITEPPTPPPVQLPPAPLNFQAVVVIT